MVTRFSIDLTDKSRETSLVKQSFNHVLVFYTIGKGNSGQDREWSLCTSSTTLVVSKINNPSKKLTFLRHAKKFLNFAREDLVIYIYDNSLLFKFT